MPPPTVGFVVGFTGGGYRSVDLEGRDHGISGTMCDLVLTQRHDPVGRDDDRVRLVVEEEVDTDAGEHQPAGVLGGDLTERPIQLIRIRQPDPAIDGTVPYLREVEGGLEVLEDRVVSQGLSLRRNPIDDRLEELGGTHAASRHRGAPGPPRLVRLDVRGLDDDARTRFLRGEARTQYRLIQQIECLRVGDDLPQEPEVLRADLLLQDLRHLGVGVVDHGEDHLAVEPRLARHDVLAIHHRPVRQL
ncbi:MAG: hypothetical protein COV59_05000 [Candidatus Magasanikbacteria bacterium CG11_big_fil_rev_8_21_14_0_20_39_34]|uniref:Uncharacterized protein n=1 Tax=Candidatus Magasanikbacteria bacterium CG11_big_fil_rev_8_21_14_0_20_39_34 TaxID=1974653 RepID=A0A2H0N3R1_9BACT|nr:MAG: hypothetical protein COV59_05000 [Candidatus Magasanikbacteria bacterium CG11_big_fil_rev_8_21_14_0_20_39_34]